MLVSPAAYFYSAIALIMTIFNPDPDFPPSLIDVSTMLESLGHHLGNSATDRSSTANTNLMVLVLSMAIIYSDANHSGKEDFHRAPLD